MCTAAVRSRLVLCCGGKGESVSAFVVRASWGCAVLDVSAYLYPNCQGQHLLMLEDVT
jgi:hypothetical protein